MTCKYCRKLLPEKGKSHQLYCEKNPNRKIIDRKGEKNPHFGKKGSNQFSDSSFKMSEETKDRIRSKLLGKKQSENLIQRRRDAMKSAVLKHPESYSGSNVNGRVKKIFYRGVFLDSKCEFDFVKWCENNNIEWEKNKKGFKYIWNGERTYFPDFYLVDLNLYVEIKGYQRERDEVKWKSVQNLIVLKINEIRKIQNGTYDKRALSSAG